MTLFIYILLAIGFLLAVLVIVGLLADKKNKKSPNAQRDTPQEEQQHDPKANPGQKKKP